MILLVDDETEVLLIYKELLTSLNFTVITANNPSEAIDQFDTHEGDISTIITDYHMPDMNGIELIQTLRQRQPSLHAFLMSGGIIKQVIPQNIHYFQKPFSMPSFLESIQKVATLNPHRK